MAIRDRRVGSLPLVACRSALLASLWLLPRGLACAANLPVLPAPPGSDDLEKQFPVCPPDGEPSVQSLLKCEGDLEAYRVGVLEGYNQKIGRYVAGLTAIDQSLEQLKATHEISDEDYTRLHTQISDGLDSARTNGSLFGICSTPV
jgi:hypothetical protein